jgi:hypothetical protein
MSTGSTIAAIAALAARRISTNIIGVPFSAGTTVAAV